MTGRRLIDKVDRERQKPMRILVLSMPRTGTSTLCLALRKLSYTPHQMRDVLSKPSELNLWQEAIDTTLLPPKDRPSNRAPYGKPEFDKLLADYDVVMDLPGCVFAKELVAAYPDAKVILTKRRYEDWERSMRESIWCLDTWRLFTLCRQLNITQLAPLMRLVHSVFRVHSNNAYGGPAAQSAFENHYDIVRSSVPTNQLLELDMDDADVSWLPLCTFLEKPVPKEPFPRTTEEKAMRSHLDRTWWGMVQYFLLMILLPGSVVLGSFLLYTYADEVRAFRDGYLMMARTYIDTGKWE
ncbi:hypothetical protein BDW02DRAFT_306310 [Decorospora gaudefroyi]|uniref:P-loop containing nucleoside triphosphate hydrolase protein n=1 Tax=Decorospora gaudefroyi TaxID=184978 RepID=A0A6A5KYP4_9PLEO|nr:hypothetical protein BDW02DRAFT_306310 [Decorospora gaudefroyi]